MKVYKIENTLANGKKSTKLLAQFSKADEVWLDAIGADEATENMTLPEQKDEHIARTELMLKPFGLKTEDIIKFEESTRVLWAGKEIAGENYTTKIVEELEPELPFGIDNFILWLEAHEIAEHQWRCYNEQVSGVWSIDAKEFCEKYNLNFREAEEDAFEAMHNDYDVFFAQERAKLEQQIGDLTEEQVANLDESCREQFGFGDQDEYVWHYILRILEHAPSFEKYYEEYKREEYYERFI